MFMRGPKSRMIGIVLELNQHARESVPGGIDEFVNEFVVGGTGQPLPPQANIIWVVEELVIIGADIQHHGQAVLGVNASAGRIKRELADWNAHAVGAKIAKPQDALAIGHDDELRVIGPIGQKLRYAAPVIGADEHAARALEDQAEALAGEPHRGRINQWLDFIDIVAYDTEEQRFIS